MDKRYTASQKNKLKEIAEKYTGEGFTEIQNDIYDIVRVITEKSLLICSIIRHGHWVMPLCVKQL